MEKLLHYVWQHRIFPPGRLVTTDGEALEIVNPGLGNQHAGPDFFGAQVRIGDVLLVGNVEIHTAASDWFRHGHHEDAAYDNVVLHVVENADAQAVTHSGRSLPQLVLKVPQEISDTYDELMQEQRFPPCHRLAVDLETYNVRQWLDALCAERFESKTERLTALAERLGGDWERVMFASIARSFGFGTNSEAFQIWGERMPIISVGKHRDDLFQVEAFFMGFAGLLDENALPKSHREEAMNDAYYRRMQKEYSYLSHKFGIESMPHGQWRFMRMRPQNFPYVRLSQLAVLFQSRRATLSSLLKAESLSAVREALSVGVTDYWTTHYVFGMETKPSAKRLNAASVESVIINGVLPMLFAYGRHQQNEAYCERALDWLHTMKAEVNYITKVWQELGLPMHSAADTQALIQLRLRYCDRKDCLRCRFGYEYFKKNRTYHSLGEPEATYKQ